MRILIAPDSFKECLSAQAVAQAIATGWQRGAPQDELLQIPLADGGEGTTAALVNAVGGTLHSCQVSDPIDRAVNAQFGVIDNGATAIVEIAEASGLHLLEPDRRNALTASSYGSGELIKAALQKRPRRLIVALGGSATTDAGVGLLQALGAVFTDAQGCNLQPGGAALAHVTNIDLSSVVELLRDVQLIVASDVTNPLLGANGTARIFAPQKGASVTDAEQLELAMQHYAHCAQTHGFDVSSFAGSGAAGGIAGSLCGFLNAELVSGAELIMQKLELERHIANVDLVITGEGCLDAQSASGKTVVAVCRLAKKFNRPAIALVGMQQGDLTALHEQGLVAAFSILNRPASRAEALANAAQNLEATAEQLARCWHQLSTTLRTTA